MIVARAGIAAAIALAALLAPAAADASIRARVERTAELLRQWRYDDARAALAKIADDAPRNPHVRYLRAELAFLRGEYEDSLELLEGIEADPAGAVGDLRKLVASTYSTTRGFAVKESSEGHFAIHYPPGKDELIVDLTGEVLEKAYDAIGDDLGFRPEETVRVEILSDPADLARVSTLTESEIETTGTIALCKYGKLMVVTPRATLFGYPWMDTLVHEYVHYVISRVSHDTVPVWLQEGLARFEQDRWRAEPGLRLSGVDEHLLARALREDDLVTFEEMHPSMAKLPSQQAAALAFAEVYSMVSYLHGEVGYDGIRRALARQRRGEEAREAVASVVGEPWRRVERRWKRYLHEADLESRSVLAGRASARRIRFKKGGEPAAEDNVGVSEVESGRARKFTRLGGILRSRGRSAAAAREYEKALEIVGRADPFVAGKLSRTYLELERYEEAIELAAPLAEADENDPTPPRTLGVAYLATDDVQSAREAFEAALRISPFDPTVRCGLAKVYAAQDETDLADREREACRRLRP